MLAGIPLAIGVSSAARSLVVAEEGQPARVVSGSRLACDTLRLLEFDSLAAVGLESVASGLSMPEPFTQGA